MQIQGTYLKCIWRNEKTGLSSFHIKREDGSVTLCEGVTIPLTVKAPLLLTGYWTERSGQRFFYVKSAILKGFSEEVSLQYLTTSEFRGYGRVIISKLLLETGPDIFGFVRDNANAFEMLKKKTDTNKLVIRKIAEKTGMEKTLQFITDIGGTYANAYKLYKEMKEQGIEKIKKNPYALLEYDIDIMICEKLAKKQGFEACDRRRTKAIVKNAFINTNKNGNTKIEFWELVKYIHKAEQGFFYTDPLFIANEVVNKCFVIKKENDKTYIYNRREYEIERNISENVLRLFKTSKLNAYTKTLVKQIESELGLEYSAEQKNAFAALQKTGIKIITGGPGTGKTTLLNGCIKAYAKMNKNTKIKLCAPTGCAAEKMQLNTGMEAKTVHKLLGIRYFQGKSVPSIEKVDADVIIVDEASMLDMYMFYNLIRATKSGATLILLGDVDQLPSVDAGNILHDLIASNKVETYRLKTIFRQKEDNLVIANSRRVISGDYNLKTDPHFCIKEFRDENSMLKYLQQKIIKPIKSDYNVLVPARKMKYASGSIRLNQMIHETKNGGKTEVLFGSYAFSVGDKVIFNRNNYDKEYYNGEHGVITDIQEMCGIKHVTIETSEKQVIKLTGAEMGDVELGYATTAHKAQGSECDNIVIIIPREPKVMLRPDLLYVEITRAKKNVVILTEQGALKQCVENKTRQKQRETGLLEFLQNLPIVTTAS